MSKRQEIEKRVQESGIMGLEGLPFKAVFEYLHETNAHIQLQVNMIALGGFMHFSSCGYYTTYRRNGRNLELVQALGKTTLAELVRASKG